MNKIEKISLSVDKFEELIEANAQLIKRYGMDLNYRLNKKAFAPFVVPFLVGGGAVGAHYLYNKYKDEKTPPAAPPATPPATPPQDNSEPEQKTEPTEQSGNKTDPMIEELNEGLERTSPPTPENKKSDSKKSDDDGDETNTDSDEKADDEGGVESDASAKQSAPAKGGSSGKRIDPKFQKMINFYLDKYQQNWQKDKIEEDGAWGSKTQSALDFISSLYENKYKFKNTSDLSNLETLYNDFAASQQGGQEQQAAEPQAEQAPANQYKEFTL